MTVYRATNRKSFEYDFWFRGRRYRGNTFQTKKDDAGAVEAKLKERLRLEAGGIAVPQREDSPTFRDWAKVFMVHKRKELARPDHLEAILPVALRFWGAPDPKAQPTTDKNAPFHNLRLCDPITDPEWILKYEAWLDSRGLSNQSKNHYRGLMRRMYAVALLPAYRKRTGVMMNPFAGIPNDPTSERTVTLEPKQVRAWISASSYHVRLALAIAALSVKLRLTNVLNLQWAAHFDPDPRKTQFRPKTPHYIRVGAHKTARRTGRPLVAAVSNELLEILKNAWKRAPNDYVVTYRGRPVKTIRGGVKAAAEEAGLTYGRDVEGGVTFHTIRHTVTSLLSDRHIEDPLKLRDAVGHTDLATTMKYRHLKPRRQKPALEQLSHTLGIGKLVTRKRRRAARKRAS